MKLYLTVDFLETSNYSVERLRIQSDRFHENNHSLSPHKLKNNCDSSLSLDIVNTCFPLKKCDAHFHKMRRFEEYKGEIEKKRKKNEEEKKKEDKNTNKRFENLY